MKNSIRKVGSFYTRIIMGNIGIFIFIGLLSVIFNECGWIPNKNMYAISQFTYYYMLWIIIAYSGGQLISGQPGGILAVLGTCGLVMANRNIGLFGAMLFAPAGGYLWKYEQKILEKKASSGMQMLWKNLVLGITGCALAACSFYIAAPILNLAAETVSHGADLLAEHNLVFLLSIVVEPAKVFFLNNVMNHGILVPLGMNQVQEMGQSCLFLLEANPGPGFGVLAALWYTRKDRRNEYISAMLVEMIGGIHEVYFPFVLSEIGLLIPLILGGMSGCLCFALLQAGLQGAVSPGSIITILLMAGRESMAAAAAGVVISAFVAFAGSVLYLKRKADRQECIKADTDIAAQEQIPEKAEQEGRSTRKEPEQKELSEGEMQNMEKKEIRAISFVCDGGMGSSAMGAAIFRRMLASRNLTGIQVGVSAADLLEEGQDLIVCQEDFFRIAQEQLNGKQVYTVKSFLKSEEYEKLIEQIVESRG